MSDDEEDGRIVYLIDLIDGIQVERFAVAHGTEVPKSIESKAQQYADMTGRTVVLTEGRLWFQPEKHEVDPFACRCSTCRVETGGDIDGYYCFDCLDVTLFCELCAPSHEHLAAAWESGYAPWEQKEATDPARVLRRVEQILLDHSVSQGDPARTLGQVSAIVAEWRGAS